MSRKPYNQNNQRQSSPVPQPTEAANFEPPKMPQRIPSLKAMTTDPSTLVSWVPPMGEVVAPVVVARPSTYYEFGYRLAPSRFQPLSRMVPCATATPTKLFPPLSSSTLSMPQTLPPLSAIFGDIACISSSQKCATERQFQRQFMSISYPSQSAGLEKPQHSLLIPAAPSISSIFDEDLTTTHPPSPFFNNLPSTEQRRASKNIYRESAVDVGCPETTELEEPFPAFQSNKGGLQEPALAIGDDEIEDVETGPSLLVSKPFEGSATGRLSSKREEVLEKGFTELDQVIRKIKASTGLSTQQIIRHWRPPNLRDLNFWNIYQKYFHAKKQEELQRLREEDKPADGPKANMKTVRAAYKAFQQDEPNHESILEVFWRSYEIDGSNNTPNGRCRDFSKYINSLKRLAECASTINGFEIAFCAVGGVADQNQSLSATFCSRGLVDFFSDRFHLSDNDIEGQLQAYVYDQASRLAPVDEDIATEPPRPDQPLVASGDNNNAVKMKNKTREILTVLKDKFMDLVGPCKISRLRQTFSDIPKILAQNGWIMENWPENVPFPCDLEKGQGIANLRARYRQPLLRAFEDRHYPLKVTKKYPTSVPPLEPVIIGVPPPPDSEHTHGRRRFLDTNQTTDRKGPARLISIPGTTCKEGHPVKLVRKRTTLNEGGETDDVRYRKRRKEDELS